MGGVGAPEVVGIEAGFCSAGEGDSGAFDVSMTSTEGVAGTFGGSGEGRGGAAVVSKPGDQRFSVTRNTSLR